MGRDTDASSLYDTILLAAVFPASLDSIRDIILAPVLKFPYLVKMTKLNGLISDDDEEMPISYIKANMESIWAIDKLRGKIPKELAKVGLRCNREKHRYCHCAKI